MSSRPDSLAIVQFIHPGREQTAVSKGGWCPWNSATRSDKAWPHRRKFMSAEAAYERGGVEHHGPVVFWGEWEGPSFARRISRDVGGRLPQFCHIPALYEPASYEGLLDTDPFVFGDRFLYCGCQQHTAHHRVGGAAETFLRRLAVGSLILFGSSVEGEFVLDTVFVVGDHADYPVGSYGALSGLVPREYYPISLHPQATGNRMCADFRLYRGAPVHDSVAGMYSFTPCRPRGSGAFARPRVELPGVITQSLTQGKKMTAARGVEDVRAAWVEVRRQVEAAGLALAHRVELTPKLVAAPRQAALAASSVRVLRRETSSLLARRPARRAKVGTSAGAAAVVVAHSSEVGEYLAIRSAGKEKPYTQSLPECRPVVLRHDDHVADVGAFVGEYALRCVAAGVSSVRAYEPTPASYAVLSKNLAHSRSATVINAVNAAVVAGDEPEVVLRISRGNGTRNRVGGSPGSTGVRVRAVRYSDAIVGATVVKLDVEGAEWTYPIAEHLGPPLRALIIEFHPREPRHEAQARKLIQQVEAAGFRMVYPSSDARFWERFSKHGKQWGAHRTWVRELGQSP